MALSAGSRLGPYVVHSLLGSGGMGEVYRAFDERLRREVALKLIARRLTTESDAVDRFIREALAVSALNHPNIVTIHETGEADEGRFIAMEFVQGRTLRECMRQGLSVERAVDVARQIAEALAVAHAAQIVHRDIKPDNVMVRDDGYVKVLDFGLARVATSDEQNESTLTGATRTGLVLGTVGYMSPEQARGENVTLASDVFAYGILLYELLSGQHPFHAASPLAVLHGILSDAPVPPSRMGVEIPPALDQLTLECLQKDARLRPSAAEVASRLRGNEPASAHIALSTTGRPATPPRLVGREAEFEMLTDAYWQAAAGRGLVVAVAGEPGLGKTALVENALNCLSASGEARIVRGRCSERLAGSEAYLPFLEALDGLLRTETHGNLARVLKAVAPNWYVQVMSLPENDSSATRVLAEAGTGSQQRMKREMAAFLEEASRLQPVVVFLDDLHWADGSTVDLLGYLARSDLDDAPGDRGDLPAVGAAPGEAQFPAAEAGPPGARRLPRDFPPVSRAGGCHRIPRARIPESRLPRRVRPVDPSAHGRAHALCGRLAPRPAAPPGARGRRARRLDARRRTSRARARAPRIGSQHDSAKAGRPRRRRAATAGGGSRARC